jgi:hypothetical protein
MAYEKGLVATLPELEQFYKGTPAGDVIELMNQTNDILDDVQWMESNQSDGHLTRIRTGLPEVYWRRLYQGTPPSKSQWSQVKEGCGMLEALMELDIAETELYGDKAKQFRLSEALAFAARRWRPRSSTATATASRTNSTAWPCATRPRTAPTSLTPGARAAA